MPLNVIYTEMKLTKEILKQDPDIEDSFITEFIFNDKKIKLRLDPDDVSIDDTLILANNMLENFDVYFKKAEDIIVKDFLVIIMKTGLIVKMVFLN